MTAGLKIPTGTRMCDFIEQFHTTAMILMPAQNCTVSAWPLQNFFATTDSNSIHAAKAFIFFLWRLGLPINIY